MEDVEELLFSSIENNNLEQLKSLIKTGANINSLGFNNESLLHKTIRFHNCGNAIDIAIFLIENGIDVNTQDIEGKTPLYLACYFGISHWIYFLLYYGADPSITDKYGIHLALIYGINGYYLSEYDKTLHEILHNYGLDGTDIKITLASLVASMTIDMAKFDFFAKKIDNISTVTYGRSDLIYLRDSLIEGTIHLQRFEVFISKYRYIVEEMLLKFNVWNKCLFDIYVLQEISTPKTIEIFVGILEIIIRHDLAHYLILNSDQLFPTLHYFVPLLLRIDKPLKFITELCCILLSYGLNVTSICIDCIYCTFGYCELLEILLHTNIEILEGRLVTSIMSLLYYDITVDFDEMLENSDNYEYDFSDALYYFASPLLLEICSEHQDEVVEKIAKMPKVPLLVELSRNVARKFIIEYYAIKDNVRFYTVIKNLPIGRANQSILTYGTKLYNV